MKKVFALVLTAALLFTVNCSMPGGERTCTAYGTPLSRAVYIFPDSSRVTVAIGPYGQGGYFSRNGFCGTLFRTGSNLGFSLTAAPSGVDLSTPPASAMITGQGMSTAYGMPRVDYYDSLGYLVGSSTATYLSEDGTQMQAPVPDLSHVWSGQYQIIVTNAQPEGYYLETVGTASLNCWGRDRPDSDGDGFYDDQDCAPYDPSVWSCGPAGGGGYDGGDCGVGTPCMY